MKRATKILIVLLCASLCAGGAFLSMKKGAKQNDQKTKVHPINNREEQERIWIWS